MSSVFDWIKTNNTLNALADLIGSMQIVDYIDIIVVSLLIFLIIRSVKDTRASQIIKGIAIFALAYALVNILRLRAMGFILDHFITVGLFAILIVFQPELRRFLEQIGRININMLVDNETKNKIISRTIGIVVSAATSLASEKTGALIVLEQNTGLADIVKTGTRLNADLSPEIICAVFFPNSPLHDGAVIIAGSRLKAAGCFLPLTSEDKIAKELGTRHRAALGMSENSDAIIVVVSEETGHISYAHKGKLYRKLGTEELSKNLKKLMIIEKKEKTKKPEPQAGEEEEEWTEI